MTLRQLEVNYQLSNWGSMVLVLSQREASETGASWADVTTEEPSYSFSMGKGITAKLSYLQTQIYAQNSSNLKKKH